MSQDDQHAVNLTLRVPRDWPDRLDEAARRDSKLNRSEWIRDRISRALARSERKATRARRDA